MRFDNVFPVTVIILLLLLSTASAAGEISISAEVGRSSMAFEDRDTLTVVLQWDGGTDLYQVEEFPLPEMDKLEILGSSSSVSSEADASSSAGERTKRTFSYILGPTDYGPGVIRPIDFVVKNQQTGESHRLQTARMTIEIARPVAKTEARGDTSLMVLLIGAVGAVCGAVLFYLLRRGKSGGGPSEKRADEGKYLDLLAEIKKECVADGKLFYSRLYRLLVMYLEKEYKLEISGKTGEEVLGILDAMEPDEDRLQVRRFLNEALGAKFLPEDPGPGSITDTYNTVHDFFERKIVN